MLLTILFIVLVALLAIGLVIALLTGGVVLVAVFGDLIVFVTIVWLVTKLFKRKK